MDTERILTTHVGSLPRPKDLLDLMKANCRFRSQSSCRIHVVNSAQWCGIQ